jgi:hypothetical protein
MLDYTFTSHRSQLSNSKGPTKSKEYIYDLTNTWELNLGLLETLIKGQNKYDEFSNVLQNIKKLFQKKKHLRTEVSNMKGKLLIESQICEEVKRKIEENHEYYKDQLKEIEENDSNKEEYIKIFEKKLKEVEIYIQKNTKNSINSKFEIYKDFKMDDFIGTNTEYMRRKEELYKELDKINYQISEIKRENQEYNEEEDEYRTNYNAQQEINKKVAEYSKFYKNQIKVIEMRNKLLKSYFYDMKLKLFNSNIKI